MAARVNVCECYSVLRVSTSDSVWPVPGGTVKCSWGTAGRDRASLKVSKAGQGQDRSGVSALLHRHSFTRRSTPFRLISSVQPSLSCLLLYHYSSLVVIMSPTKLHPFLRKTKGKIVEINATENTRVAAGGGVQQYDEMSRYKRVEGSEAVLWLLVINTPKYLSVSVTCNLFIHRQTFFILFIIYITLIIFFRYWIPSVIYEFIYIA